MILSREMRVHLLTPTSLALNLMNYHQVFNLHLRPSLISNRLKFKDLRSSRTTLATQSKRISTSSRTSSSITLLHLLLLRRTDKDTKKNNLKDSLSLLKSEPSPRRATLLRHSALNTLSSLSQWLKNHTITSAQRFKLIMMSLVSHQSSHLIQHCSITSLVQIATREVLHNGSSHP